MKLIMKIRQMYYILRAEIDYKIETLQRIVAVAKIINQNHMSKELIDIVKYYKNEGSPTAHNMLMFHDWHNGARHTEITANHDIIKVTFDMREWRKE